MPLFKLSVNWNVQFNNISRRFAIIKTFLYTIKGLWTLFLTCNCKKNCFSLVTYNTAHFDTRKRPFHITILLALYKWNNKRSSPRGRFGTNHFILSPQTLSWLHWMLELRTIYTDFDTLLCQIKTYLVFSTQKMRIAIGHLWVAPSLCHKLKPG